MNEPRHLSVLKREICQFAPEATKAVLDCTLGGGGHALALLQHFSNLVLIGIDRDLSALDIAKKNLHPYQAQCQFLHARFSDLSETLPTSQQFDYIIADLGVSSFQIDVAERGFSFMQNARLDMRMSPTLSSKTAYDLVNDMKAEELEKIFWKYGEERYTRRIVKNIVNARKMKVIETTGELAKLVADAIPRQKQTKIHPATRVFQALRMEVNQELQELETLLDLVPSLLKAGGRFAVIAFHSLEDRLTKHTLKHWQKSCLCPPRLPICQCQKRSLGQITTRKPVKPSVEEVQANSRSRSAKLRIFQKNDADQAIVDIQNTADIQKS